eukprot:scaffold24543_cov195-Amphora_coffeaeformis.AAC.16
MRRHFPWQSLVESNLAKAYYLLLVLALLLSIVTMPSTPITPTSSTNPIVGAGAIPGLNGRSQEGPRLDDAVMVVLMASLIGSKPTASVPCLVWGSTCQYVLGQL